MEVKMTSTSVIATENWREKNKTIKKHEKLKNYMPHFQRSRQFNVKPKENMVISFFFIHWTFIFHEI